MPAQEYTFDGTDTWLSPFGDEFNVDPLGFPYGVTMPVWKGANHVDNNVGVPYGRTLQNYAGTINFSNGPIDVSGLNITTPQTVVGSGHKIRECRITSTYSGDNGGGHFYLRDKSVSNILFDRIEINPATPNDRWNGIYGHDFTLQRSVITHTVDGMGLYNHWAPAGRINALVRGNWLGHMAWYDDDSANGTRANGHSDLSGTHNDIEAQQSGGPGVTVIGNFLQGAKYNALNPTNVTLAADGMAMVVSNPGNGVTPLNSSSDKRYPQGATAHLANYVSGTLTGIDLVFNNNWLWNFDRGLVVGTAASFLGAGQYRFATVEAKGNRFGGVWRDYTGSGNYVPFRFDTNTILNGRSYLGRTASGSPGSLPGNDGHPEDDNRTVGTTFGMTDGSLVTYRLDVVPAAQG